MVDRFMQALSELGRRWPQGILGFGLVLICAAGPAPACRANEAAKPPANAIPLTPIVDKVSLLKLLHSETGLPMRSLRSAIDRAQFEPSVISRMESPYEAKPYAQYRPLFVRKSLAKLGLEYLKAHRAVFKEAWKRFGVEPQIIAAILGMETHFGVWQGKDRVLDTLYTLATGFPRRADFFRKQLGDYLLICHTEHLAPDSITGSYAGAFGALQFMPSSYLAYAVDGNGDGRRDVWHSPKDIVFSVANYFHKNGWKAHLPIARWLTHEPTSKALLSQRKREMQDWAPLQKLYGEGLEKLPASWNQAKVTLITMQPTDHDRTAVISRNFYVITRWNRSYNYAMAVAELAHLMGCKDCATGP